MWTFKPDYVVTLHKKKYKIPAGQHSSQDVVTILNRQAEKFMTFYVTDDDLVGFSYEDAKDGIVRILKGKFTSLGDKTFMKAPKELW